VERIRIKQKKGGNTMKRLVNVVASLALLTSFIPFQAKEQLYCTNLQNELEPDNYLPLYIDKRDRDYTFVFNGTASGNVYVYTFDWNVTELTGIWDKDEFVNSYRALGSRDSYERLTSLDGIGPFSGYAFYLPLNLATPVMKYYVESTVFFNYQYTKYLMFIHGLVSAAMTITNDKITNQLWLTARFWVVTEANLSATSGIMIFHIGNMLGLYN
jgi:hypothetical protein